MLLPVPVANNQHWPPSLLTITAEPTLRTPTAKAKSGWWTSTRASEIDMEAPPIVSPPGIPSGFLVKTVATAPESSSYSTMKYPQAPSPGIEDAELPPSTASPPSAKLRELPDVPGWAVGMLAGLLTCGLMMAVVLYFVNYPSHWEWVSRLGVRGRRARYGYRRLDDNGDDESDGQRCRRKSRDRSGIDREGDGGYSSSAAVTGSMKRRRRRCHLSVDTSARYTGLGIAMPGGHHGSGYLEVPQQGRRSFDEEKLSYRPAPPLSPARFA